jgi:hypothetical protein
LHCFQVILPAVEETQMKKRFGFTRRQVEVRNRRVIGISSHWQRAASKLFQFDIRDSSVLCNVVKGILGGISEFDHWQRFRDRWTSPAEYD